ncbi:MAG TPA: SsgA family sporulation/cell division regulator [Mycobacterium sp.]|jgi:hypothetical protein|uniref:SsgA family sporulation/cell division regulator n=1 Tax=Mycobacterium sp. TaxID=1785 RepID=UPI002F40D638
MSTSVTREYTAYAYPSGAPPGVMRLRLTWVADDPYAVVIAFPAYPDFPLWAFSRELLEQGLDGPVGMGDVRCSADPRGYTVTLLGSRHEAGISVDLVLERSWVTEFLAATTLAPGSEPYGDALDSALAELLGEEAA